jgi:hypothetical protein
MNIRNGKRRWVPMVALSALLAAGCAGIFPRRQRGRAAGARLKAAGARLKAAGARLKAAGAVRARSASSA